SRCPARRSRGPRPAACLPLSARRPRRAPGPMPARWRARGPARPSRSLRRHKFESLSKLSRTALPPDLAVDVVLVEGAEVGVGHVGGEDVAAVADGAGPGSVYGFAGQEVVEVVEKLSVPGVDVETEIGLLVVGPRMGRFPVGQRDRLLAPVARDVV